MKLYIAVTQDKYELPLFVGSCSEVAEKFNVTTHAIHNSASDYKHGKRKGKFMVVDVDDD